MRSACMLQIMLKNRVRCFVPIKRGHQALPPVSLWASFFPFDAIQQGFFSRTFDFQRISAWLTGVGIVVLCILLFLGLQYLRSRRLRYTPQGSVADPIAIRNIIANAFEQRRPFEVQIAAQTTKRRPTLRCSPVELVKNTLILEINGLKSLSDRWRGREVNVFFRIMVHKDFMYYTFASNIADIQVLRQDICYIRLPLPSELENRQKRSFLRISPPREFFMGAAIWYNDTMPIPEAYSNISGWPRPKLFSIPNKAEHFKIVDLSAGGLRLSLPHGVLYEQKLSFRISEQIMLMIDLYDPEQTRRLRFWLLCRIQNVWIEHPSGDAQIGAQFLSWARPRESQDNPSTTPQGIEWLRLSPSHEVESLGNWIMRRHLELFRENPTELG